jgi:hypothetical protein
MGRPIHKPGQKLGTSALRILIAWLLAFQPMVAAHAAAAMAGQAPLAMELCRGAVLDAGAVDQGAPAQRDHSAECCLACAPASAPPPLAEAQVPAATSFAQTSEVRTEIVSVAKAGLGPQSARAPPL